MPRILVGLAVLLILPAGFTAENKTATQKPSDALRALNDLIGSWRASGTPEGTREEKQRGFWTETIRWTWQFKGGDVALKAEFDKGKYFSKGELRYLPDKDQYRLSLTTPSKDVLHFQGPLKDHVLTLDREDDKSGETQRLVLSLFHGSRFNYTYEVKLAGRAFFVRRYRVGSTKEGVAFAGPGDNNPECVVSGGLGKIKVTYKGQTYYVCCTGCQEAFKDDPEKYLKEYAERKAKEAKEKNR
jgi:YHS domain-containing protein